MKIISNNVIYTEFHSFLQYIYICLHNVSLHVSFFRRSRKCNHHIDKLWILTWNERVKSPLCRMSIFIKKPYSFIYVSQWFLKVNLSRAQWSQLKYFARDSASKSFLRYRVRIISQDKLENFYQGGYHASLRCCFERAFPSFLWKWPPSHRRLFTREEILSMR